MQAITVPETLEQALECMPTDGHRVGLLVGDGIGREIATATCRILAAARAPITWELLPCGADAIQAFGEPMPQHTLDRVGELGCALKGPIETPIGKGYRSVNVALRQSLDLYAQLRPVRSLPGLEGRYQDVDLVIVRENTEDLYVGIEFAAGSDEATILAAAAAQLADRSITAGSALAVKPVSHQASERIAEYAFKWATGHRRASVTCAHKANIQKHTDGLFLEATRQVAERYPDILFNDLIIDALCMRLVVNPTDFDVLVCPNLYGDIVSDLCAGLVGGLGLVAGANVGDTCAVFEPVHGSAPDIAGTDRANPTAMLRSACMLLRHLDCPEVAAEVEMALEMVLVVDRVRTPDLARGAQQIVGTQGFADAIIARF